MLSHRAEVLVTRQALTTTLKKDGPRKEWLKEFSNKKFYPLSMKHSKWTVKSPLLPPLLLLLLSLLMFLQLLSPLLSFLLLLCTASIARCARHLPTLSYTS